MIYRGYIGFRVECLGFRASLELGVVGGLYRDHGKENGNCDSGFRPNRDYVGIMVKKMETTV